MKKLTVITYLHQNETQFQRCIDGIESQTFKDFDWLILTHSPIKETINCEYIEHILPENLHHKSDVLNHILPQIKTPYFAYNDSDDRSLPNRFEEQVNFLDKNPTVDICSAMFLVNETDATWPMHEHHDMIAAYMLINSPMANPVSILRNRKDFWGTKVKYNPKYIRAQDYDFWFSCLKAGLIFHNLQLPLLSYYSPANPNPNDLQEQFAIEIRNNILENAGLKLPPKLEPTYNDFCKLRLVNQEDMVELLHLFSTHDFSSRYKSALLAVVWQLKLLIQNHRLGGDRIYKLWINKFENKPSFLKRILKIIK